jgi:hypothetical protein
MFAYACKSTCVSSPVGDYPKTLRACRVFGRHMIERHYGRIINIAVAFFVRGAL